MSLGKQAKILTKHQVTAIHTYLGKKRHGLREQVIFLLSVKAGLRAKEIASLKWSMVLGSDGEVGDSIHLTNDASKGRSGRIVPLNMQLRQHLEDWLEVSQTFRGFDLRSSYVVQTERAQKTSAQTIVNKFAAWYNDLGLVGCSSHSGRRTFITSAARKIGSVGGSLRDVQALAGHSSLAVTQRYIEGDEEARKKVVGLL